MRALSMEARGAIAPAVDGRDRWRAFRVADGASPNVALLTEPDGNPKLAKSEIPTFGLSLAPANMAGLGNLCPAASGCVVPCLQSAGRGGFAPVAAGRIRRTRFLDADPAGFVGAVEHELRRGVARFGEILFRPNVLSDVAWEIVAPTWFEIPGVTLYDYTKRRDRAYSRPYAVALSAGANMSLEEIRGHVAAGIRVSVVADVPRVGKPKTWFGLPAVDADLTDAWILGTGGAVGLLAPKGRAKNVRPAWNRFVKPGEAS